MIEISYLKHLYEVENKSLTAIAKTMGINFRTVKKYASMYDFNKNIDLGRKPTYPVLGAYISTIDEWLENDLKQPRKQRHTAVRVHRRLQEEHGFNGGERCVHEYVRKKKAALSKELIGYIPLEHNSGEAQMDWGEMQYINSQGMSKTGYYLVLSFPYSNAAYSQVFPCANSECLMEGMKRIFYHIGGVPSIILTDNMSTIVSKIEADGTRKLTESIIRFLLHHRFEFRFCNRCAGNEKGHTENKVGYTRRNFFVPVPTIEDLDEYNKQLLERSDMDMQRDHYKKQDQIAVLWEEEKAELLALPESEFDVFTVHVARINSYGCIVFETNSYSVAPELSGQQALLKIYSDKLDIYYDHRLICTHSRCYGNKQDIFDWKHYIGLLSNRVSALEHARFYNQIPKLWQEHVKNVGKKDRRTALLLLKEAVTADNIEVSSEAIRLSYEHGKTDTESIRQFYYSLSKGEEYLPPCELGNDIPLINYNPDLTYYDKLTRGESNEK